VVPVHTPLSGSVVETPGCQRRERSPDEVVPETALGKPNVSSMSLPRFVRCCSPEE
jgi:hypothetical protein